MKKKKILVVAPSLRVGSGIASHIMSYYREICNEFEIDFAACMEANSSNVEEILKNGSNVFYFKKSFLRSLKPIRNFFKQHIGEYDIVHCHSFNYGLPYLFFAKKYGVNYRILHMHSIKYSDNRLKAVINVFFVAISRNLANIYVACSKAAGEKAFRDCCFHVINNGIILSNFTTINRLKKRKELGVRDDEFLFGNVGRLTKLKNQLFAIELFKKLKEQDIFKNSKFLIIGSGPEYERLVVRVRNYNLADDVIFVSSAHDIANYYAAMDGFIFPSLYEGLGMVLVEAQASGLPCFCYDSMPEEVLATELIHKMSRTSSIAEWNEEILKTNFKRQNVKKQLIKAGFDIRTESKKLVNFYERIDDKL